MSIRLRRREFITLLGGAATWPLAARAQQGGRVRRIGWLIPGRRKQPPNRPGGVSAFTQALAGLGWTDGRNVRIDLRGARGDTNRIRLLAQELVGLQPDIIATDSTPATAALQRETRTIPIVFAGVTDPVGSGNRPAGVPEAAGRPAGLDLRLPRRQDQRSCAIIRSLR
jgi:putative ABC transport system substrate-binding protein